MAIPNTTPTPNELYNGEMKKMKDTELRVVLVVTRATLGWEEDKETKMRKKEDWISHFQIKQKTGRSGRAISTAVDVCMKNGWIEARDADGNLLDTPEKRAGKKIFYRLGKIFLSKITPSEKSSQDIQTSEKSSIEKSSPYKRNTITKETLLQNNISKEIQKTAPPVVYGNKDINDVYAYLKSSLGGTPDGTIKDNRRFAKLLLDKFRKDYPSHNPVDVVNRLIDISRSDGFHAQNATSFKYLYYNCQKIIQAVKGQITNPRYVKIK